MLEDLHWADRETLALLGPVTGMTDAAVVAALRRGVGLQLVAADRESFRFLSIWLCCRWR